MGGDHKHDMMNNEDIHMHITMGPQNSPRKAWKRLVGNSTFRELNMSKMPYKSFSTYLFHSNVICVKCWFFSLFQNKPYLIVSVLVDDIFCCFYVVEHF